MLCIWFPWARPVPALTYVERSHVQLRYISTGITGDNSGNIINYMDEAQWYTTSKNSKDNPDSTSGNNLEDEPISNVFLIYLGVKVW